MRIHGGVIAMVLTLGTCCASAAELNDQDRTDLRQRAQELQNQRSRNPDFQPGEGRLSAPPIASPVKTASTGEKSDAKSDHKETRGAKAKRKARSLKNIAGAFVRRR